MGSAKDLQIRECAVCTIVFESIRIRWNVMQRGFHVFRETRRIFQHEPHLAYPQGINIDALEAIN